MNKVVKLSLILFLVSAIVAGVLGLTNFVTEKPIAEYQAKKTAEAYSKVMQFESYDEVEYTGDQSAVKKVYKTNDGNWIGIRLPRHDHRRRRRKFRPYLQRYLHHFQLRDLRPRLQGK